MIKEYKHYSVSIDIIDRRGRLFKVKVVINSGSVSNLIYPLLINWRKLLNKEYKEAIPIRNGEKGLYKYNNSKVTYHLLLLIKVDRDEQQVNFNVTLIARYNIILSLP